MGPNTYGDYSKQVDKALEKGLLTAQMQKVKRCQESSTPQQEVKRNAIRPGIKLKERFPTFEAV